MKISNVVALAYIQTLQEFLDRTDILGYAAARNIRKLTDATIEYNKCRNELIVKYGVPLKDENGNLTGQYEIRFDSPNFKEFSEQIENFDTIEHDIEIMTIPYSDVFEKLTGSQILSIDWMLKDSDKPIDD